MEATVGPVRALLLDLDDTLFDRGAAFARWLAGALGRAPCPGELAAWQAIDGRGRAPRERLAEAARAHGFALEAARFPFELAAHVEPEAGAVAAIAAIAVQMPVAVVTDGGAAQRVKLERAGLAGHVHAVFVSSEVGVAKPGRALFERALVWTGMRAGDVAFVGDEPALDLAPAAALGMITVWRPRGAWPAGQPAADHHIGEVRELLDLRRAPRGVA